MTTTQVILNYAIARGGIFKRKELLQEVDNQHIKIKEGALDLQLNRLYSAGRLLRKGRGMYMLNGGNMPYFVYLPSTFEKNVQIGLKKLFPLLDICVWSPKILSSFMQHIPNIGYVFVDVEKDGMEQVFNALHNMKLDRNILIAPNKQECEQYLMGSNAIVVRQLIGQSPLTTIDGCTVPCIEKILVDAVGDKELYFASGAEIYNIYENSREKYNVNLRKLLRYASRRNRKYQVERIIKTIENDKSKE